MIQEIHIPTIGGSNNVINLKLSLYREYEAYLSQQGENPPVQTVQKNTYGDTDMTWSYSYVGGYFGQFPNTPQYLSVETETQWGNGGYYQNSITDERVLVYRGGNYGMWAETEVAGTYSDDILQCPIYMKSLRATDNESIFGYLLLEMTDVQLSYWQTIILRTINGTYEVSGDKYRKTGSFALSSKAANL